MATEDTTTKLFCSRHPNRETLLRCNRCEKPICSECAVLTPTGYRCVDCVRSQQKSFETAQWYDYPLSMGIAGVLSFIGSYLVSLLGFFTIFVAPIVGVVIAEAVRMVLRRRRSPRLFRWVTVAAVVGSLPILLTTLLGVIFRMQVSDAAVITGLLPLVWRVLYTFLVASSLYYRLTGIRI